MKGFEYSIKAIPTKWNGTQYRSRLEAQWAAFLEATGHDYIYEPFDLIGWTPDFLILDPDPHLEKNANKVLAEVKPVSNMSEAWPFFSDNCHLVFGLNGIAYVPWFWGACSITQERYFYELEAKLRWEYAGDNHHYVSPTHARLWKSAQNETQWIPRIR